MSTFGIIFTAYNMADLLPFSLPAWITARRASLGGHTFKIAAVCCPFAGFPQTEVDDTLLRLQAALAAGDIDHLVTSPEPITEVEARGRALTYLRDTCGVNTLWQWDADEKAVETDIQRIAAYVEQQPYVSAFCVSYRNLVFDERYYIAEPFTPMRIHRVHIPGGHIADGFYDDNNVRYTRPSERGKMGCPVVYDTQLASMTVPPGVASPLHYSWLTNARSKAKIRYQLEARGWPECSFRWDEATDTLQFNESYYTRRGLPLPEVLPLEA